MVLYESLIATMCLTSPVLDGLGRSTPTARLGRQGEEVLSARAHRRPAWSSSLRRCIPANAGARQMR